MFPRCIRIVSRRPSAPVVPLLQHHIHTGALAAWTKSPPKQLTLEDRFSVEHLSKLYVTLPTRDGFHKPSEPPGHSQPLGYGHHLAFFHTRTPEHQLRSDGTDGDFCPPEPFIRRMWAGGKMTWDNENPLRIGEKASAIWRITSVEQKGMDTSSPLVFVKQQIEMTGESKQRPSVVEERTHVYLPITSAGAKKSVRKVDVPKAHDFSFTYTPSQTTLFRFSALTFNGHHIHLDKDYAQHVEGYPERLVHGPLTALMLLETAVFHNPQLRMRSLEYRAQNALVLGRQLTINGTWLDNTTISLWCQDETGVVGMTGVARVDG